MIILPGRVTPPSRACCVRRSELIESFVCPGPTRLGWSRDAPTRAVRVIGNIRDSGVGG